VDPLGVLSRRKFLIATGVAGAAAATGGASYVVAGLATPGPVSEARPRAASAGSGAPLVVVSLYGGNDGLNTVVPATDPAYQAARPTLGYRPSEVLELEEGLYLNPKLVGLQAMFRSGLLAVVRGVGYPNPNLSHFASMDIWQSANPVDGTGPGWLGRWLDLTGSDPLRAISVGPILPPMLKGETQFATALTAERITLPGDAAFQEAFSAMSAPGSDRPGLLGQVAASSGELLEAKGRLDSLGAAASGPSPLGSRDLRGALDLVASLIKAGSPTRVYQVSLSSFDTHADEKANHENLLAILDQALVKFFADIAQSPGAGSDAVVMTFSEFGRRPAQNASGGTDHGAAAPLFVAGRRVAGGRFYGEEPSLTQLDPNGNVVYNVDFRSVYATVIEDVLGFDSKDVLGSSFKNLGFIRS